MTTEDDDKQAVKDAPVWGRPKSEEKDIGTLQWYQCEELPLETWWERNSNIPHYYGLPTILDNFDINFNNGTQSTGVVIKELSSTDVLTLYKSIHFPQTNQKFFDVLLYCKAVRNTTPKEAETPINDNKDDEITEVVKNTIENVPRPVIPGLPEEAKESANIERNFQFSAYEDNYDSESDDTSDAFEDSNETVNDIGYENFPDSFQSKE